MTYTNLNLPEATVKLLESKGGIKALTDRDIAVENDNLEALRKVLKAAFPEDVFNLEGTAKYYGRNKWNPLLWGSIQIEDASPSIPASILVRELEEKPFEWGERVWVSEDNLNWKEAIYIEPIRNPTHKLRAIAYPNSATTMWKYCQREKPKPSPLRITREMIKEKFGCQEFELVNEKG